MAHLHSVYDNDTHFKIDPVSRQIKNESGKVVLMQNDHNSERFTFEIPRYIDGHDMSTCNKVEVHYINLKADKTEKHADVYPVNDLEVSPASDDVVICSWLISQNATKYAGSLNFVLRYACLTGSIIDYQWYTDIHKGIAVSESISNTEYVATEYSDVLEAWKEDVVNGGGAVSDEQIARAVEEYFEDHPIEGAVESDAVPSYWQSHLAVKAEEIWQSMESAGRNKSAFFFYSDAHWWAKDRNDAGVTWEESYTTKTEPTLLRYLYQNTPINKTNFGGDFVGEEAEIATDGGRAVMSYIREWRKALRDVPNHHSVPGNHDDGNEKDNRFSEQFVYSFLLAPEEKPEIVYGDGLYYYIDNNAEKTRYLYLDTAYKGLDEPQTEFVREALLNTKDGWHIVAIAHKWYESQYNSDNTTTVGSLSPNGSTLLSLFDSYNARSGDFAACGARVEFCIGGHTHWDYDGASSGGIPVILCEASSINNRSGLNCDPSTTNETAISAIIANYNEAKIDIVRIGRGANREVALVDHTAPSYSNVILTSIDKDGNIFNGKGWADNSRIGSGGIYLGNGEHYVTGYIEIDPNVNNVIRMRNIGFDKTTNNNYAYNMSFFDASFAKVKYDGSHDGFISTDFTNETFNAKFDGNNLIEATILASVMTNKNVKYFAICGSYIGDDSIITINEEIE